jgi:hypothetical protein
MQAIGTCFLFGIVLSCTYALCSLQPPSSQQGASRRRLFKCSIRPPLPKERLMRPRAPSLCESPIQIQNRSNCWSTCTPCMQPAIGLGPVGMRVELCCHLDLSGLRTCRSCYQLASPLERKFRLVERFATSIHPPSQRHSQTGATALLHRSLAA